MNEYCLDLKLIKMSKTHNKLTKTLKLQSITFTALWTHKKVTDCS